MSRAGTPTIKHYGAIFLIVVAVVFSLKLGRVRHEEQNPMSAQKTLVPEEANEIVEVQTPEEFFGRFTPVNPVALFTIGLSGSGKSYWSEQGRKFHWERIDIDEEIKNELRRMAEQQEVPPELGVVPDPENSRHFYLLRKRGHDRAMERLQKVIALQRSFIWDSLGLDETKISLGRDLQKKGYHIWWLIFQTDSITRNRYNLFLRESRGGFGSFREQPIEERCKLLNRMLSQEYESLKLILAGLQTRPEGVERIFQTKVIDLAPVEQQIDPCKVFDSQENGNASSVGKE